MRVTKFLAGAALAALGTACADASVVLTITQSGSDVVATATGSLDLSTMNQITAGTRGHYIGASSGAVYVGTVTGVNVYSMSGPSSFGSGANFTDSSVSGLAFGLGSGSFLDMDSTYVSGATFTSTGTWANSTFASLGLTTGTYAYTAGSNQITLNIGAASAVPEPASWAMMLAGFGAIGFAMRRKTRTAVRFG